MSTIPITQQNIRDCIPEFAYSMLFDDQVLNDGDLTVTKPGLSNDELEDIARNGRVSTKLKDGVKVEVKVGCHNDEAQQINGIFLCIHSQEKTEAYVIRKNDYDRIEITHNFTEIETKLPIDADLIKEHLSLFRCAKTPGLVIESKIQNCKDPDKIEEFFDKNQDMLPESLRLKLSPPETNYFYIGVAALLTLVVAYIAKSYFNQTKPTPASL